jgi:hypothetical protein
VLDGLGMSEVGDRQSSQVVGVTVILKLKLGDEEAREIAAWS